MQYIEDVYDMGEDAFDTSMSPEFLGGVGGIIAGATLSGLLVSTLSFSGTIGQVVSSGGIFLIGAGLYGYGLSNKVMNPALRSASQITGVVVGGVGLGRLLASLGAPTFGLGAEDRMGLPDPDDGRVIGQDYNGLTVGQAAEDDDSLDRSNQDYKEDWNSLNNIYIKNAEGPAMVEEADPEAYNPKAKIPMGDNPSWSRGVSEFTNPYASAEKMDIMTPSSPMNGVPQWYGSAEEVSYSSKTTAIGNLFGGEGMGSIIGQ